MRENIYEVSLGAPEYDPWQLDDTSEKINRLEEKVQKMKTKRKKLNKKGGKRSKKAIKKCNRAIKKQKKRIRKLHENMLQALVPLVTQLRLTNDLLGYVLHQQLPMSPYNGIDGGQFSKNMLSQNYPRYLPKGD